MKKEKERFKVMSVKELTTEVDSLRRKLFILRLNSSTTHVKDSSQFSKLKKSIARSMTCLREKLS